MNEWDQPSLSLLVKLGSLVVHADEFLTASDPHPFDKQAFVSGMEDAEVISWIKTGSDIGYLPVKRTKARRAR